MIVGLDIQPGQAVAARVRLEPELRGGSGQLHVEEAAGLPLPPEVVRDGEVIGVETLSAALRELFSRGKFGKRVRIGVANQRIVVRRLELPPISDPKELATAVRFQAQDEIPMPLDSVVLDFHSLGIVDTVNGPRQQVVLVAARREMVDRVLQAARGAGLRPEGVDLSAFAMIRALRPPQAPADERVLYLAVGGLTNLAIAEGSTCQFTRVIGGGLEQMVVEVAERCALPVAAARDLIAAVDLSADALNDRPHALAESPAASAVPGLHPAAEDRRTEHEQTAHAVLRDSLRRLAAEVRNSLDFHQAQEPGAEITRAVLCGPAVDIAGFHRVLSSELGLPVTAGAVDAASATTDVPSSRLTIAAGLAIEDRAA
ncbi:MAG: type IV pilus assembly protein PilM [Solirubrobacteraceae bacterium]